MMLLLSALCFSGLLFCAENDNAESFKFDCIDLDTPAINFIGSDGKKFQLQPEEFLKFYQKFPALEGVFHRSANREHNALSVPMDYASYALISKITDMDVRSAQNYIPEIPTRDLLKMLRVLLCLKADTIIQTLFKEAVIIKFNDNAMGFYSKEAWKKYESVLLPYASIIDSKLIVENYSLGYSREGLTQYIQALQRTPITPLLQSWHTFIALHSFNKIALPKIKNSLDSVAPGKIVFSDDLKFFTVLANNRVPFAFEYRYSDKKKEYRCFSELGQIEDCWYLENNSRVGKYTSNFYTIGTHKRYLTSIEKSTPINHVAYNNNVVAIGSEKKVILKYILKNKIKTETHLFSSKIKQIIPQKQGFVIQKTNGNLHHLIVGQTYHKEVPLALPDGYTIKRLMFDESVLAVGIDNDPYHVLFYPLNSAFETNDSFGVKIPVPHALLDFHDDAILSLANNEVHCLSFAQPFIEAVEAVRTNNIASFSQIYDRVSLNQ